MRYLAAVAWLAACGSDGTDKGGTDGDADTDADADADTDADTDADADTDTDTDTDPPDPDADGDGAPASVDCDDTDDTRFPGAAEVCDEVDQDCDREVDEGVTTRFFRDDDLDGFGVDTETVDACAAPAGFAATAGDCDDGDSAVFPGAVEVCDGRDDDCANGPDDGLPTSSWFPDGDVDGHGVSALAVVDCAAPPGHVALDGDCDDARADVFPGATEVCDGVDQDCDTLADDGLPFADYAPDVDQDGYGDPLAATTFACAAPPGTAADATDCDDADGSVHPGAIEVCDTVDQDCSGLADDGLPTTTFYRDGDRDGFGGTSALVSCVAALDGYAATGGDCDDARSSVHPGAPEIACDGRDQDCAGGDVAGDWDVPADFSTIQAAVTAAAPGDTICVAPGSYTGIVSVNKDLDLVGTGPGVVLSTGNGNRVYVAASGAQRLVNLTLDGRSVEPLIQVSPGAALELDGVVAKNVGCNASCNGLVAYQYAGSSLTVRRLSLVDDDGVVGDGNDLYGLFLSLGSPLHLEDVTIGGLTVDAASGAFLVSDGGPDTVLRRVTLWGVTAAPTGDFALLGTLGGSLEDVQLRDNDVQGDAVTALVRNALPLTVDRALLSGNLVSSSTASDAGLVLALAATEVSTSVILDNEVSSLASAELLSLPAGSAVRNVTSSGNVADGAPGIAIALPSGGAVSSVALVDDVVDAEILAGPGATVDFSLAFGPSAPLVDGALAPLPWTGLAEDPLFYPYSVLPQPGSPLIDAGDPAVRDDDGSRSDIGAFGGPGTPPSGPG
jgi:hypothetical protein